MDDGGAMYSARTMKVRQQMGGWNNRQDCRNGDRWRCAVLLARERNVVYTAIIQNITHKHQPIIIHAALDALFFSKKA